jgi:PKD repeat protein
MELLRKTVSRIMLTLLLITVVTSAFSTLSVTALVYYGPYADFTWAPLMPKVGELVTFDASASTSWTEGGEVPIISYEWDFGDGTKINVTKINVTDPIATHTYNGSGIYTVTLDVTDSLGRGSSYAYARRQKQVEVAPWVGVYDRKAAYDYAQKYWDKVCSDGYFWGSPWRPTPLPAGTLILGMEGYDGPHFVSCCIGREPNEHGGGLPVPSWSPPSYGDSMAMRLYSWLIQEGWAKEQPSIDNLKRGDVILYARVAIPEISGDQVALYLGGGKVAAHTPCVWGVDWRLGGECDEYHFIHIIVPPIARFTYSPLNPLVGVTVTFDASSSYDLDGTIVSYKWNFGDGTTATGRKVTHNYFQDGSYAVKLTVTDDNGNINSKSQTVTVLNRPPIAYFTYSPSNPLVNQKVTFDASSSYDPYGNIVSYKWNFGDGYTGTGKIITHTYSKAGQFTVKLTVTDNDGKSISTSKTVTVVKPKTNRLKISDKYYDIIDRSTGWTRSGSFWYLNYEPDGKELPKSSVKYAKYTTVDDDKPPPGQCVDFVRVLSNNYQYTKDWSKGPKVMTCTNIEVGTVIATFFGEGGGYGGHVAVFAGFTSGKTGFKVFDQNWKLDGCVGKHFIYKTGSDVWDADNYYIVTLAPPKGMTVKSTCPVDLVITDPDGFAITKEFCEIPEAIYIEEDLNGDGSPDDYVFIPERKIGEYLMTVIPEPDADPAATYTLEVATEDATLLLAENVPISEIPTEPYILDSTTFDTPPVTLLTIGEPQYTDPLNNLYVSSRTPFEFTAEDNVGGSGVMTISYRIYNHTSSTGWLTYEEPFNLTHFADGLYFIDFNSTDYAGNVEPTNTATITLDNAGPSVAVMNPPSGWALQDGVTFVISAIDVGSGVSSVNFSIREVNGGEGTPVGFEDLPTTYNATTGKWIIFFDTLQLPDGYYVVVVKAEDNLGNIGSTIVPYSIRNWAVIELLPASKINKAGRTMPVKFAVRVATSVDPNQPFVYNENLTIHIYDVNDPSNILQTSTFGDTARDYRIDIADELYITNFRTLKTPTTYAVEVYRKEMLIDTFEFSTVK